MLVVGSRGHCRSSVLFECVGGLHAGGWELHHASALMSRHNSADATSPAAPMVQEPSGAGSSGGGSSSSNCPANGAQTREVPGLRPGAWNLFAFPAESNFSGVRYDPAIGLAAPSLQLPPGAGAGGSPGRWAVLVDAAKACGSCPPDLTANPHIDFLVCTQLRHHFQLRGTLCPISSPITG